MARKQSRLTQRSPAPPRSRKAGAGPRRTAQIRSRSEIFEIIRSALRAEFPLDTVDVSDGYRDNIHVLVVSRKFDGMGEEEKQDLVWNLIDRSQLTENEKRQISLIITFSPAQLK